MPLTHVRLRRDRLVLAAVLSLSTLALAGCEGAKPFLKANADALYGAAPVVGPDGQMFGGGIAAQPRAAQPAPTPAPTPQTIMAPEDEAPLADDGTPLCVTADGTLKPCF